MIYKGKWDKRDPANYNYRGISLLSMLLKYTGVLAQRLNDWTEKRGVISGC
jgi:hypothetical protein